MFLCPPGEQPCLATLRKCYYFMKKIILLSSLAIPLVLAALCLKPLTHEGFDISVDQEKLAGKKAFLLEEFKPASPARQPNIIVILADDLGLMDISLNGNAEIQTPHIDAIAREGVVCSQGYVSSAVCAPSRAGLLTGRYQQRFGFENQEHDRYLRNKLEYYGTRLFVKTKPWIVQNMDAVPGPDNIAKQGLPPAEITLAEMLKKAGYQTAITGKWHLGNTTFSRPAEFGFDYQYGFYASHSLYAPEGSPGIVDLKNKKDWTDQYIWKSQRNGKSAIYRNGEPIEEKGYLTQRIADEAIGFIERNRGNPFFLYVPFNAPHTPLQAPKEYFDRFPQQQDSVKRVYQAMIAALDDAVGRINDRVKSLGIEENTLIFFLSDNGGATYTLTTDNGPLKGGKITGFEGGLRVPFFVKWKGVLPEHAVFEKPVSSLDIFATACAAAGAALPTDRPYDGVDLLPFLSGVNKDAPHEALFWKAAATRIVLRDGWKLIFDDKWGQTLLYHLAADPYEKNNLAAADPARVEALKTLHFDWSRDFPKALWPPMITFVVEDKTGVYYFEI